MWTAWFGAQAKQDTTPKWFGQKLKKLVVDLFATGQKLDQFKK